MVKNIVINLNRKRTGVGRSGAWGSGKAGRIRVASKKLKEYIKANYVGERKPEQNQIKKSPQVIISWIIIKYIQYYVRYYRFFGLLT